MGSDPVDRDLRSSRIATGSVKVCGVRTIEHALIAADAGAELIGMIFAPARRQVSIETARQIADAVHTAAPGVRIVGVFVDATADEINAAASAGGLDFVQLNGDEPADVLAKLHVGAIKALRPVPGEDAAALANRIQEYLTASVPPVMVLIDGYDAKADGGTGVRADWGLVAELPARLRAPVGLAGGLTPANVAEAIATVGPLMVDTSSGVEIDGIKDETLIRAFVARADAGYDQRAPRPCSAAVGVDRLPGR